MEKKANVYIDLAKFICALLAVKQHTAPILFTSGFIGFLEGNIPAATLLALFFSFSGYFFAKGQGSSLDRKCLNTTKLIRTMKRIFILYLFWSILYLPIILAESPFPSFDRIHFLHDFFFLKSYYQLWFFVGLLHSLLVIYLLNRIMPLWPITILAASLFLLSVLQDSYHLIMTTWLNDILPLRHGMLFVLMGIYLQKLQPAISSARLTALNWITAALILTEYLIVYYIAHINVGVYYITLVPLSLCLFLWLRNCPSKDGFLQRHAIAIRKYSILIYGVHTAFIFLLGQLIQINLIPKPDSAVMFLSVSMLSLLFCRLISWAEKYLPILKYLS